MQASSCYGRTVRFSFMPKDKSYHEHKKDDIAPVSSKPLEKNKTSGAALSVRLTNTVQEAEAVHDDFTLVSWNILDQELLEIHKNLYKDCKKEYLSWKYRKRNLIQMIAEKNADIVSLQEVSESFKSYLSQEFEKYHLVYGVSPGKGDGCLTMISKERFNVAHQKTFCYQDFGQDMKANVANMVTLKCKTSKRFILVANTHLVWNPKNGRGKLQQINALMEAIENRLEKTRCLQTVPVIICGDMNFTTDSFLFNYVVDGKTNGWPKERYMSGQLQPTKDVSEFGEDTCPIYAHPFIFNAVGSRAYPPQMSTIVQNHGSIVDHIFVGCHKACSRVQRLQLKSYLSLPTLDESVVLPNETNPSDHVPLYATFAFKSQ